MQTRGLLAKVEQWGMFELKLNGRSDGNPFTEVNLKAKFTSGSKTVEVSGFYDGDGIYKIRLMPDMEGRWSFVTESSCSELDGVTGEFDCIAPTERNHGPVRIRNTYHFAYTDGTPYYPVGTTCYAWTHQGMELQEQTLQTLEASCFNKIRMCVFPKHYDFNTNAPLYYPYEGSADKDWDFERFNPAFFRHLEKRILDLQNLGIEADLILFHPYDRWEFSSMPAKHDLLYLEYIFARLAAFRNVWWSLANEYDGLTAKTIEDWDRIGMTIHRKDPCGHLCSIHNGYHVFDHSRSWITHCIMQRIDPWKPTEDTDLLREKYKKAVIYDEFEYEGNLNFGWGNITAEELVRRAWYI